MSLVQAKKTAADAHTVLLAEIAYVLESDRSAELFLRFVRELKRQIRARSNDGKEKDLLLENINLAKDFVSRTLEKKH